MCENRGDGCQPLMPIGQKRVKYNYIRTHQNKLINAINLEKFAHNYYLEFLVTSSRSWKGE